MKFTLAFITLCILEAYCEDTINTPYSSDQKVLTPEESAKIISHSRKGTKFETLLAKTETIGVPSDNGGNYGDLIYRYRENGDKLLLREVVIHQELASVEQDVQWYAILNNARRISSVRALNLGRQRAYTVRIDVAANEAQVIFKIPPHLEPRVLIEIYGF